MSDKPLESLTEAQKQRLGNLTTEIVFDKITVSYLIEARGESFAKKAAFYSATISRKPDELCPAPTTDSRWSIDDLQIVRSVLCKHVIAACYSDAVKRRMMTSTQAREEVTPILAAYDMQIAKNLSAGNE
jgi:hypothetical protein